MRFMRDLVGQGSALIRDMVVYDATSMVAGQAVSIVAGANGTAVVDPGSAGTLADIVGVLTNAPSSSITALASGTLKFGKVSINPLSTYLAQYDAAAANDVSVVSSTATATTLGTTDDNMDGGWMYANSGTGVGQLAYIGAASTTVMTLDTTDEWATTPDSTTDIILIRPSMSHPGGGGKDLDSTFTMLANDESETGELLVLENYIQSSTTAFGPMRPRQHHMIKNLDTQSVKFYGEVYFTDNVFQGATTMY